MATYVLVGGAWIGGWAWTDVAVMTVETSVSSPSAANDAPSAADPRAPWLALGGPVSFLYLESGFPRRGGRVAEGTRLLSE